jgi:DNA-binding XRE family transcriptional regulator
MDAQTFKTHRKRLHATQTELAAALGVHRVTLARWETGVIPVPSAHARLVERMKPGDVARFARTARKEGH